MKKIKAIFVLVLIFVVVLVSMFALVIAGIGSGGAGGIVSPVIAFATEEEAYAYQYIGTELGVPWDIVMLADGMKAYEEGDDDLSKYNPILTSLEFCMILENEMIPAEDAPETSPTITPTATPTTPKASSSQASSLPESSQENSQDSEETEEKKWVSNKITYYTGRKEILKYIGEKASDLTYEDVNSIVVAVNEVADEKSTEEKKYVATIVCNPNFEDVLKKFIGLDAKNIEGVMEIYSSNYLVSLYGYSAYTLATYELPDIVQGNVTRNDLASVAVSLIGHPYLMGGKSSEEGSPKGPLDCSGFVDWVYIQCFGVGASNGSIPEGIAVSGTAQQWYASTAIKQSELKVGDLGFYRDPASIKSGQVNHVGIYLGTYNGKMYWIHCGGSSFGTDATPKGRVGISVTSGYNSYNPVDGTSFDPAMKSCKFRYFRRPQFQFVEE